MAYRTRHHLSARPSYMSRRFRDKTCAYCTTPNSSKTADHVFAREFIDKRYRDNLPKVPACTQCNNDKSKIEHYLVTVLPFGSRRRDAQVSLWQDVPRKLAKNLKLLRLLASGVEYKWVKRNGLWLPQMTIPFDGEKYQQLFAFITRGLLVHHWNIHLPNDHEVLSVTLIKEGEPIFATLHNGNARQRVTGNIGDGTFQYEGAQAVDNPNLSVWKFTVLEGIELGGEDDRQISPAVYTVSARNEHIARLRQSMGIT